MNERSERNERNVESKTAAFAEARNANVAALLGNTDACDPLATKQPMTKIEEKTIETSAVLSPKLNKIVQGINQTWKDVGQEELTGPKREGCDSWNMLSDDEFAEEEGESNDEQQTSSIAETQIDQSKSLSTLGMRPSSPTKTERLERSKSTSLADSPDRAVLSPTRCTSGKLKSFG